MQGVSDITVVILAGGLGVRLRSVVDNKPKVLAKVAGRPFLSYLLDQLLLAGAHNVILCCGYMAEAVQDCFGEFYKSLELLYSIEQEPLGTGGAIRLAVPYLRSDTVLVMNGDSYIDVDLAAYVNWFFENDGQAALVLTKVNDTSRYGAVCVNGNRITAFEEKNEGLGPGWVNAGIYLISKSLILSIPSGEPYSLEHQLFPELTTQKLLGFCVESQLIDIGTPDSYAKAQAFLF